MKRNYRVYPGRYYRPERGRCRWCALPILREDGSVNRRKTFCGPVCVTYYLLRADSKKMREHIFFRDGGRCATCGFIHPYNNADWELDHERPLVAAHGAPSFWEPENCRVLCRKPCHVEKTQRDILLFGRKRKRVRRRS